MVQTDGGVGYAVTVPVGVAVRLPQRGSRVSLFTELVVKEDGWALFGFDSSTERQVFHRCSARAALVPSLRYRCCPHSAPSAPCAASSRETSQR